MRLVLALALLAAAVRILFWVQTDRVWEDALITILHAENAVAGLGLTHFKVDEPPIHGFTSPLSVLVPLLGEVLHPGWGLATIRIASVAAGFLTVVLAALLIRRSPGLALPAGLVAGVCGYLAIEHHQILWGMAGMETQMACAILLFSALCCVRRNYSLLGIAAALCVLVRPDFAIWTVILGAFVLVDCRERRSLRPLLVTVGVALACYLPWIVFTSLYYGSPVPNTIVAKSTGFSLWSAEARGFHALLGGTLARFDQVFALLGPSFGGHGTGFVPLASPRLALFAAALIPVSLAAAVWGRNRDALLLHAFFLAYTFYYVYLVPIVVGWYVVPYTVILIILVAHGFATLVRVVPGERVRAAIAWAAAIAYLGLFASFLPATFKAEREIQALIEGPVRVQIGKYLNGMPIETTAGGEPLGYVGYHSRRTYYDYPGLASRRVVGVVRRTGKKSLSWMLREIQPDCLVLRTGEAQVLMAEPPLRQWIQESYVPVRLFEAPDAAGRIRLVEYNMDRGFVLFRRAPPSSSMVPLERLARPLAGEPRAEPAWSPAGAFPGTAAAPPGARWFGSWSGSDANVGRIEWPLQARKGDNEIGVPFLTGPLTLGLAIRLVDTATGEVLQQLEPVPASEREWGVWRVQLPPDAALRQLTIVAVDQGKGWGNWLAVAVPHALHSGN